VTAPAPRDGTARTLALVALAVALVALVLAGYAVALGTQYLEEVQQIGESVRRVHAPSLGPPPALDPGP
jgi:hypothetical protein